jgi:hypothetical protein
MRASVSPRAADDLLGLGPGRTQELCTAGLIRFTNWAGHRGRGDDRLVDRSEIQRIRDEVRRHVLEKPPGKPIPFKRLLLRAIRPQRASFADVYQAILAGQLRGYLSDAGEPLFENLCFEEDGVTAWIGRHVVRAEKLRLGAVAERLGVETEAVHQVVAAGLLDAPGRQHGYLFDAASVAAFEARYVFDVKLPRPPRGKLTKLREQLAARGVRPVVTVRLGAGARTTAVYRKADLGR